MRERGEPKLPNRAAAKRAATPPTKRLKTTEDSTPTEATPPTKRLKATEDCTPTMMKQPASVVAVLGKSAGEAVLATHAGGCPASFSHERSRSQFMARSGFGGPGSSMKFKYGATQEYRCEESARVAAKQWVDEQNQARGLS